MPAFVFRRGGTTYYLVRGFDALELDRDQRARHVTSPQAAWLFDEFCRSSEDAAARLDACVLRETGAFAAELDADHRRQLRSQVRAALQSEHGAWQLFARERVIGGYLSELAKELSVAQEPDQTFAWIEFDVLDQRARPIAGVEWQLLRGSEKVRSGGLNAQGNAYADGIDPGTYKIVVGQPEGLEPVDAAGWLGLELVDASGVPLAAEAYQVVDSSGLLHEGVLDAGGRAMLHGLPAGNCKVTFPRFGSCELAAVDSPAAA